jgi:DDE superfamily endonuclease
MRPAYGPTITTGERKSMNMVSAISPRGELRFRVHEGKMNAGKFIDFLRALLGSVPGKIFLIVDGYPVHKAKKVSEFVKEKADGRLGIFSCRRIRRTLIPMNGSGTT